MTTINELIAYLQTLPEDTELKVNIEEECLDGYGTCIAQVPLDIDPFCGNVEYINTADNENIKPDSFAYNKRFLIFGGQG